MKPTGVITALMLTFGSCMVNFDPVITDHYPLAAGNTWQYQRTLSTINFRPIVAGATMRDTSIYSANGVHIVGRESIPGYADTWKFLLDENGSLSSYTFYRTAGDSLQYVAYTNGSLFSPKQARGMRFAYGGRLANSIVELVDLLEMVDRPGGGVLADSLYYEPRPVTTLAYPLLNGKEWTYRVTPFRIKKQVDGRETIVVPAGQFQTATVRWFWDTDADGLWDTTMDGHDYVGTKGLMKRTFLIKDLALMGPNSPEVLGYFDVSDEFELTSMNVQ